MTSGDPLISEFADDPEMMELVEMFVAEIGERISSLEEAHAEGDLGRLRTLAHQLKGSAGGYGFQPITEAAGRLERQINNDGSDENLQLAVDDLLQWCHRATAQPQG